MALLVGELKAALGLDTSKYDEGLDRSHAKFGKFVKTAAIASAAVAVAAGAGLLKLAKGAAEDEAAQKVLATTLKNTAGATDAQVASIERYISKTGAATGVTDDEMRPALANLVRATHDVGQAQSLMGIAMDVSTGTGRDLGAVTLALAKAQNGSVGGLAKLGIATKDASGKTMTFDQIQKNLAKTFKGQTAAAADTTAGRFSRLKLILSEAGESIGAKLLPIASKLGGWLLTVGIPAVSRFGAYASEKLLPPLRQIAGWVGEHVVPALQRLGGFIVSVLVPYLTKLGTGALAGVRSAFHSVAAAIERNRPQLEKLVGAIGTVIRVLYEKLGPILAWIVKTGFKILGVAIGIVIDAIGWLVTNIPPFVKKVGEIGKAIGSAVASVFKFFRDLPGNIVRALGNTGLTLVQKGKDLVAGLKNGITSIARTIGRWMYDHIISPAVAPFVKAGTWLHQAGANVIAGFLNGLKEIWAKVTVWISGIATWIRDHKGPVSLDGRLLVPAGKAIMSGFLKGLQSGAGPAWDFVSSVGGKTRKALEAVYAFTSGAVPAGRAGNVALGQRMAASLYGWTGAQWDTLYNLWLGESGWNNLADNPTSTAFGIPQFLAGTARQYGVYGVTDPAQQIAAGLRYIADRYGSPIQAFGAWMGRSPHWYAKGTPWVPNDQLAFVHRGEAIVPAEVNRAQRAAARTGSSGGPLDLSERSLQRLAQLLAGIAVKVDARSFDAGLSREAMRRY